MQFPKTLIAEELRTFEKKFEEQTITDCTYENFELESIEEFPNLLKKNPGLKGLNITIPYKEEVVQFLNSNNQIVEAVGACNCIKISGGKLFGYNTDVIGFEKSLRPLLKPWHKKSLILGNGGATEAVTFVLRKLNISFDIVSRSLHTNSTLCYKDLGEEVMSESLLIINTTPLGMYPQTDQYPDIPYEFITEKHFLYDLIYNPSETMFLQKGKEKGAMIKNGEEMLVLQAEESWSIWNN